MRNSDRLPRVWLAYLIVGLTFLAPLLGGTTTLWAKALLMLGTGLLLLAAPPRKSPGFGLSAVLVAIGLISLVAFLPAGLLPTPPWRSQLTSLGTALPATFSAQPWLTWEAVSLLWLGLAWTFYLLNGQWPEEVRRQAWDLFCAGIVVLAATVAFSSALGWRIPFWPEVKGYGFFPNRNQTGNVLGLGAVMIYANAFQHLQEQRNTGWVWLTSLTLVLWALIVNYSRGGIILFFAGAFIWQIWWLRSARGGGRIALAWIPFAVLLGLLLLAGGETWLRLRQTVSIDAAVENGRVLIQRDALEMWKRAPWFGVGLGNFRSLFAAHRKFYFHESEAIHPESDWLWAGAEMGGLVPLLLLLGIGIWLSRCLPLEVGTWRGMRVAGIICGLGFALHGFFDVSGHRIGSLWPALFLVSTATHSRRKLVPSGSAAPLFRVLAFFFIATAIWWTSSVVGLKVPPTTVAVARIEREAEQAAQSQQYEELLDLTNQGLRVAPLHWALYYDRGVAAAGLGRGVDDMARDFSAARFLLPNWPELYAKEGLVCLTRGEADLAFAIWREGMTRLDEPANFYNSIYGSVMNDPELRERWIDLGRDCPKCLSARLRAENSFEFQLEAQQLLANDPELRALGAPERQLFFQASFEKGDRLTLVDALKQHPDWQPSAWWEMAQACAGFQDFQPACAIAARFVPRPDLPPAPGGSIATLQARFAQGGAADVDGVALLAAQVAQGDTPGALTTVDTFSQRKNIPKAVFYLEAQFFAAQQDWKKAWEAMRRYVLADR